MVAEDGTITLNTRVLRASENTLKDKYDCSFYRMGIQIALFLYNEANVTDEQKSNLVSVNKVTTTSSKDDESGILALSINMEGENLDKLDTDNISARVTFKTSKPAEMEINGKTFTPVRDYNASGDDKIFYIDLPKLSKIETDGLKAVLTYSFNLKDLTAENFPEGFLIELNGKAPDSLIENFSYSEFYNYGSESGDEPSGDDPSGDDEQTYSADLTLDLGNGGKLLMNKVPNQNYYLGIFEMTDPQMKAIVGSGNYSNDNEPTTNVSWYALCKDGDRGDFPKAFIEIMNEKTSLMQQLSATNLSGYKFNIPTKEQWHYACLAGGTSPYGNGKDGVAITEDNLSDYAYYSENSDGKFTHLVGQKLPNAWGFYDMLGNVWEWVSDNTGDDNNPTVYYCGGSCNYSAEFMGMDYLSSDGASAKKSNVGFRIALVESGEGESEATLEPSNDGKSLTINLGDDIKINLFKPEGVDYYLGETEVTQAQYFKIMGTNPSGFKGDSAEGDKPTTTADYPVEKVKWISIMGSTDSNSDYYENNFMKKINDQFADKLAENNLSGYKFTLPTREQWECCFYAGSESELGIGENSEEITDSNIGDYAVYNTESPDKVKSKKPNAWGFYDMHGNVSELTADSDGSMYYWYRGGSYKSSSTSTMKPENQSNSQWSVLSGSTSDSYRGNFGFRIALVPAE